MYQQDSSAATCACLVAPDDDSGLRLSVNAATVDSRCIPSRNQLSSSSASSSFSRWRARRNRYALAMLRECVSRPAALGWIDDGARNRKAWWTFWLIPLKTETRRPQSSSLGIWTNEGYPPNSSSAPTPESATLRPCAAAARL